MTWRLRPFTFLNRAAQPLPAAQASGRAGVRTDQARQRLPPVPLAWPRSGPGRMGHDLHRPQPPQARNGTRVNAPSAASDTRDQTSESHYSDRLLELIEPRAAVAETRHMGSATGGI